MNRFMLLAFASAMVVSSGFVTRAAPSKIEVCQKAQDKSLPDNSSFGFLTPGLDGAVLFSGDLTNGHFVYEGRSQYFGQFDQALKSKGIHLLVTPLPTRAIVHPEMLDRSQVAQAKFDVAATRENYRSSLKRLSGMQVDSVDLLASAMQYQKTGSTAPLFFSRDNHWTTDGSKLFAQSVAHQLAKSGALKGIKPVQFSNKLVNSLDTISWLAQALQRVCETTIEPEKVSIYETTRVGGDLLGEDEYPVVLVGSSYSFEPRYNFEGFLKELLQVNVLNAAINAGGFNASLEGYFQSKAYAEKKPKVIVWEFSTSASPWEQTALRELIPSVYGDCADSSAVLLGKSTVLKGSTSILKIPKSNLRGPQHFVSLKLSDKSILEFDLNLKFDDGKQETVKIVRSDRIANEGQFYLKFADEFKGNLTEVVLTPRDGAQGNVSAKICKI
jgi:alginate biosynthesis protein AlgX